MSGGKLNGTQPSNDIFETLSLIVILNEWVFEKLDSKL